MLSFQASTVATNENIHKHIRRQVNVNVSYIVFQHMLKPTVCIQVARAFYMLQQWGRRDPSTKCRYTIVHRVISSSSLSTRQRASQDDASKDTSLAVLRAGVLRLVKPVELLEDLLGMSCKREGNDDEGDACDGIDSDGCNESGGSVSRTWFASWKEEFYKMTLKRSEQNDDVLDCDTCCDNVGQSMNIVVV